MLRKREIAREEKPKIEFNLEQAVQQLDKIDREIDFKKRELNKVQVDIDSISDQLEKDFGARDIKELEKTRKKLEKELQELTDQIGREYEGLMDMLTEKGIKLD